MLVGRGIAAPFIVKDMALAFKGLGCNVTFLPLRREGEDLFLKAQRSNPDCIIALDHTGLNFPWVKKLSCRKVAWFVDNPFYFIDTIDKENILFCFDKDYVAALKKEGFQNVFFLPHATNRHIFKPLTLAPFDREKYTCDVSFVGSIGKSQQHVYNERTKLLKDAVDDTIHGLFDRLVEKKFRTCLKRHNQNLFMLFDDCYSTIDKHTKIIIDRQIDYEVGTLLREGVTRVLRSFNGFLFGNRELARMQSDRCRFKGEIDYHTELPKLFNGCCVNINATRPQLPTTVNQRVYDISATNSFFLTDYRKSLETLFPFNVDAICYYSLKDLEDKIKYYLINSKEREELAYAMYKPILREHTYNHRMQEMLTIVSKFL
ncbi:MAG: glycosyltransferase [Candidatus Omnitrophica bacterium]|nr:glycosyltransferase [Candidatus Omnitrophota bacterium]